MRPLNCAHALHAGVGSDVHPLLADGAAAAHRPAFEQLYPINALRNLAAQQAATPLLLFADCDFVFSAGLQEQLHTQQAQQQQQVCGSCLPACLNTNARA